MANTSELRDDERQTMGLRLLVGIAVAFLWVGRYQIVSTNAYGGHLRLDRWTGAIYLCGAYCRQLGSPWHDIRDDARKHDEEVKKQVEELLRQK
jgi:hypothetical protein